MKKIIAWCYQLLSAPYFYQISHKLKPWFGLSALLLILIGIIWGLFFTPMDYQQSDSYRILFIHAPSAWMSLFCYIAAATYAFIVLVWRTKLSEILMHASLKVGLAFTIITLVTGALWGKPMWGAYWTWGDARLTSMLILLFIYLGILALYNAFEDERKSAKAAALFVMIGLINIPIIHYSVEWWSSIHQTASISLTKPSAIDASMLTPLIMTAVGTKLYFIYGLLLITKVNLLKREQNKQWVIDLVETSQLSIMQSRTLLTTLILLVITGIFLLSTSNLNKDQLLFYSPIQIKNKQLSSLPKQTLRFGGYLTNGKNSHHLLKDHQTSITVISKNTDFQLSNEQSVIITGQIIDDRIHASHIKMIKPLHMKLMMHGYGFFVWSAYGFFIFTTLILIYQPIRQQQHLVKSINYINQE